MTTERTKLLRDISRQAGSILRDHFGKGVAIKNKGTVDLVTVADETAEKHVVAAIIEHFPEDHIIAEEGSSREGSSAYRWIIDPLDGTTNFASNFPHFSVSVALVRDGAVVAGVVYDPMKEEFFEARLGEGAYLNGTRIHVGEQQTLINALAVTGFSYDRRERMAVMLGRAERLLLNCRGLRRLGSAALDLAYIASGRFDLYMEDGLNAWDVAAGHLLVREAGGKIINFNGTPHDLYGGQVIAANPVLTELALGTLV